MNSQNTIIGIMKWYNPITFLRNKEMRDYIMNININQLLKGIIEAADIKSLDLRDSMRIFLLQHKQENLNTYNYYKRKLNMIISFLKIKESTKRIKLHLTLFKITSPIDLVVLKLLL